MSAVSNSEATASLSSPEAERRMLDYINLKLALLGCPMVQLGSSSEVASVTSSLVAHQRESDRLLASYLSPADQRIQTFIYDYLEGLPVPRVPTKTFSLDRAGMARVLSLPARGDEFHSDIISSYRVKQGVLHNPKNDRRTTQGSFHIAEGGLPIPADKIAVPRDAFAKLLGQAFSSPADLLRLPFSYGEPAQAETWVSLLLRPLVLPGVEGFSPELSMEVRFFAPGGLVSNLDFVETIFGNGGDPYLPENDSGLDAEHWTGHTGCVILAPHLVKLTKKSLGLLPFEQATERQRRDGMCWKTETECYNGGQAFKLCARDASGAVVTIIADNYFGYCKKEVKTQISFAANLFGLCEEEHAGGALVYPSYDLGEEFSGNLHVKNTGHSFAEVLVKYADRLDLKPEGYAVDKQFPQVIYVPEDVSIDLQKLKVSWVRDGETKSIKLLPGNTYVRPSGYKVHMEKPPGNRAWRLIGTVSEGTFCHKPCTVSGGGKSEISKSISDAIIQGPVFVADFKRDFDLVEELINRDYSKRFTDKRRVDRRPILAKERSLGSVIKLLTPSPRDYTDEYNAWLQSLPQHIMELVFVVKRFYKPDWAGNWREHFGVDIINGTPGNELKLDNRKLVSNYLRVGYDTDGSWRTFGLRKDFHPAEKVQMEDDISASVVVPARALNDPNLAAGREAFKFVKNCETRLFQRPDDAILPGYDHQTEHDFSVPGNFFSNYEPLTVERARDLMEDSLTFYKFTDPMQSLIRQVATSDKPCFFVCNAQPRIVDGKPTKNPRYLQPRLDLIHPKAAYLGEMSARLQRRIGSHAPVFTPVDAVLPGRRNNPPDGAIRPLCVFNPIHYMELPELFLEFISSMTGKSPSTTGAGSEGALTKSPFNALPTIIDLNNALVSYILTGQECFITSAGYVGPHVRVDHDVSLLVPEVWSRMTEEERDAKFLIKNGYLERCPDFKHDGKKVLASRLGYRVTPRFVRTFFGRMFNHPHSVFTEAMLRPETQDMGIFADGMENIVTTHKNVGQLYFDDASVEWACPPLKALLHIMVHGEFEGKDLAHPELRALFTKESMLASSWYHDRLVAKQKHSVALWRKHARYLEKFLARPTHLDEAKRLGIQDRLSMAMGKQQYFDSAQYLEDLKGTLGLTPLPA